MGAELSSMLLVSNVKLVRVSVAHETVMIGSAKSRINSTKQNSVFLSRTKVNAPLCVDANKSCFSS